MRLPDEFRFAFRTLRKAPSFTASAVVVLAVAIAANTTVFSAVDAVLLRPSPMAEPDRLVVLWEANPGRNQFVHEVSYRNFVDWQAQSRTFDSMAAMGSVNWSTVLDEGPEVTRVARAGVSGAFFTVLGVVPLVGRALRPEDDVRGAPGVVVIGHSFWQQRFGGDPRAVGSVLRMEGHAYTVVGIMPPGFAYPQGAELWTPLVPALESWNAHWRTDTLQSRFFGVLYVIGRLAPAATFDDARAEMETIVRGLPEFTSVGERVVVLTPILEHVFGQTRMALGLLTGMVALVLAIACANVAGLLLTRSSAKRRDSAVKMALGARASHLLGGWLAETLMISTAAVSIGVLLAYVSLPVLVTLAPASIPQLDQAAINGRVAAFSIGLSVLTALLCAIIAARQATSHSLEESLKEVRVTDSRAARRTRRVLIGTQVAIATVLLVAAALLVRSFANLRQLELGFDPGGVLTLNVEPLVESSAEYRAAYDAILERVKALPGVQAAGAVYLRPLVHAGIGLDSGLLIEGQRFEAPETWRNNPSLNFQAVTPGYFEAMRIRLRAGRLFVDRDDGQAEGVVLVSESTARRLWPGTNPIGKRLSISAGSTEQGAFPWQTVVGVVSDVRYRGLTDVRLDVYMPAPQVRHRVKHLVVRTSSDPLSLVGPVRAAIEAAAGRTIVEDVTTMDAIVGDAVAPWRFSVTMFVSLAAVAAGLAAVGLFGLVGYSVSQRRAELAVRLAIGARASQVMRLVLWDGARVAAVGLLLGAMVALVAAETLSSLLFQVQPRDARAFVCAVALLGVVTLVATYVAARRVTRIDPIVALRGE